MKEYRDHYFLKAKRENYPARSVYKLEEIDQKFHLVKPGLHVLDLGAAPGSWSLWTAKKIGAQGRLLSCDLHSIDISLPPQVTVLKTDIFACEPLFTEALRDMGPFDLVLSDMAPPTTGIIFTDQARSAQLAQAALDVATEHLKNRGNFVVKIFMGPDAQDLQRNMRAVFDSVKTFKPKSSRQESKETFFIGLSFHGCATT